MRKVVTLRTGRLEVEVIRADMPLDELCGFASRNNAKRGYLFVSKVLGKHYPVRPSKMQKVYLALARKLADLGLNPPVVAIALAETATGLGQGVFEALLSLEKINQRLFIHTTRYHLNRKTAFLFEEPHCHAAEHILYTPIGVDEREVFLGARTLLLLDDEMSTGKTLSNLAAAFQSINPRLERIVLVAIKNWLDDDTREAIEEKTSCQVEFVSLLDGYFSFVPNLEFLITTGHKSVGNGAPKDSILRSNFGRLGLKDSPSLDYNEIMQKLQLSRDGTTLVLGTGEFSYLPYKLAAALENDGYDVVFQSATRSPIILDGDIVHKLEFEDNYFDEIDNFLYNVRPEQYDHVVACYETQTVPEGHDLPRQLGAQMVFF